MGDEIELDMEIGMDVGTGTFAEGEVERRENAYLVDGSTKDGRRFRSLVYHVYTGYDELFEGETLGLAEWEFKIGDDELHLR